MIRCQGCDKEDASHFCAECPSEMQYLCTGCNATVHINGLLKARSHDVEESQEGCYIECGVQCLSCGQVICGDCSAVCSETTVRCFDDPAKHVCVTCNERYGSGGSGRVSELSQFSKENKMFASSSIGQTEKDAKRQRIAGHEECTPTGERATLTFQGPEDKVRTAKFPM